MANKQKFKINQGLDIVGEFTSTGNTAETTNTVMGNGAAAANVSTTASTSVGYLAGASYTTATQNTSIGAQAAQFQTGSQNTSVGYGSLNSTGSGSMNTAIGNCALHHNDASYNTAVGYYALCFNRVGYGNTAIGQGALQYGSTMDTYCTGIGEGAGSTSAFMVSSGGTTYNAVTVTNGVSNNSLGLTEGQSAWFYCNATNGTFTVNGWYVFHRKNNVTYSPYPSFNGTTSFTKTIATGSWTNSTAIGYTAVYTGSNQVQLGNSSTTTYVYGSVQNRSDERDKTEIRDTILGLDFINALRPVDFKWDYREDYKEFSASEDGIVSIIERPRDGSKTRTRFHHGLIAQEVKSTIDEKGIDFGGYQDHSLSDGMDIKTIGYDELIAPLIKAVQQLSAKNAELKARLDAAGV